MRTLSSGPTPAEAAVTPRPSASVAARGWGAVAFDISCFTVLFALALLQFYRLVVLHVSATDFGWHLRELPAVISGEIYIPHRLFHWSTYLLSIGSGLGIEAAAAWVVSLAFLGSALVQRWALGLESRSGHQATLVTMALTFAGAIYVPFINPDPYLGQFSPNLYHNPTFLLMKPFALGAFVLAARVLDGSGSRLALIGCAVATALSIAAKPSFAPVFLLAVGLVVLAGFLSPGVSRRGQRTRVLLLVTLALGCTLPLSEQLLHTFGSDHRPALIVDRFLRHWHTRTPSVAYSILAALAFPIFVLAARARQMLGRPSVQLAWIACGLGMLAYATIIDTFAPGVSNIGWSYIVGQSLVFLVAAEELVRWPAGAGQSLAHRVAWILLALHVACGAYYYGKVALGYGYG